ncbi:MAG: response regulator transcription factor [Chloroflexi bacterium]|nr:response regulator transcription factor [Chloroflexota bacterium]
MQGNRFEHLSDREIEVLQLVGRGMSNKQAARDLGITLSTVKSHVSAVLAKLELTSRTQLALYAAGVGRALLNCSFDRLPRSALDARVR